MFFRSITPWNSTLSEIPLEEQSKFYVSLSEKDDILAVESIIHLIKTKYPKMKIHCELSAKHGESFKKDIFKIKTELESES